MEFQVRLFLDGKRIEPSEYKTIAISCKAIDRIVNDIYEKYAQLEQEETQADELRRMF